MSDHDHSSFWSGLVFGALAGGVLGVLFAPDEGERTRKKLQKKVLEIKEQFGDVAEIVSDAAEEIADEVGDKAAPVLERVGDKVEEAKEAVAEKVEEFRRELASDSDKRKTRRYFRGV